MNNKYFDLDINDARVMCVKSIGVKDSAKAFLKLESKLTSLRGRKFYGVLYGSPERGVYRACVEAIPSDNPKEMGLESWTIPGGKYARTRIKNWDKNIHEIAPTFKEMSENRVIDETRPTVEFYRSQKELFLLMPVA